MPTPGRNLSPPTGEPSLTTPPPPSTTERPSAHASVWDELVSALSPIGERPQVVPGIEVAHETTRAGSSYVVLHNPAANTYLKLEPRAFDLLPRMDGTRTVKALVIDDFQMHGTLAPPYIVGLVRLLRSRRFLSDPPLDAYAELAARLQKSGIGSLFGRLAHAFLYHEFPLRNIDARLGRWYRTWGRFCFTRPAMAAFALISILGPILLYLQWTQGKYTLRQFQDLYLLGFLLFFGLSLVVLTIHEIGHGLAVKHAGRTTNRGGLLIYYGFLAAFVDTTDVWMAPRRMRLLVSLAGPWTEFVVGGLCAIASFVLPPGPVGATLFALGTLFLLNNLFNFNPLLELDGYYLLVDLIEKPMLRARAFAFVRGPLWGKLWRRDRLTAEERLFGIFGLASAGFSMAMLMLALRFWEDQLQGALRQAWEHGGWSARAAMLIVGALALALLGPGLWRLLRQAAGAVSTMLASVGARATAQLHREALAALRAVPLWRDVPEARLLEITRAMRARRVAAGTQVVSQGEAGDLFYIIDRGAFEVLVDGRVVKRLGRGDYFGELALLYHRPRAATVLAVEPGRVFSLDRATFDGTLAHDVQTRERLEAAMQYREDLAGMSLFHDLAPAELDVLLTRLLAITAPAGAEIIRQGDRGDRFYIIRSGGVEVVQNGQVVATRGRGDAFGELALLYDAPRAATVRATEATELLALSAEDFHDLLMGYLGRTAELKRMTPLQLSTHKRFDELVAAPGRA